MFPFAVSEASKLALAIITFLVVAVKIQWSRLQNFQAPKGKKMPYPLLMEKIKRRKEQEREQQEGVSVL